MTNKSLPENLKYFLKNGVADCEDGFEYSSELNRILNSDDCQQNLQPREIDKLRDFSYEVKKIGEFNNYTKDRIKDIEKDIFGNQGILGFLGVEDQKNNKPVWPF
jgi:hypothetical protein